VVRVNLLPDRKQATRRPGAGGEPSQVWLAGVFAALLASIVVCLFLQKMAEDELRDRMADNARVQGQIDTIKRQIANQPEIKAKLKDLRDREDAIQKLQAARTGPTATLLELARMLTQGHGPTTDHDKLEQLKLDNPAEVYSQSWDPRRLWLTSYEEVDRKLKLAGLARDGEDVSELERRMRLSDYFTDVKLGKGEKTLDQKTNQELFAFQFTAMVKY
jgi:type IV pilus assembly protein PilN